MEDLAKSVNSIVMSEDCYANSNYSNYNSTNLASNIHPRLDVYKQNFKFKSNQEERRRLILIEQKK